MDQDSGSPLKAFSKVVEAIYDCALDPSRWRDTLGMIVELSGSSSSNFNVVDCLNRRNEVTFFVGIDQHYVRLHEEKYGAINPHFGPLQLVPVGRVVTSAMLVDEHELHDSKFYQEFMQPLGIHDSIGFNVLKTRHRLGVLACLRSESQGCYGDAEIRLFTLLAPHVCRSVAISDALNLKTVHAGTLEATLDALASGVCLTDSNGRVIYMNPAAERQVSAGKSLRVVNDRLKPVDQKAHAELSKAIAEATADEAAIPSGGTTLALREGERAGLVATVLPLNRGERRKLGGSFAAACAIFVQDPVVVPPLPGEAFAKLYRLTGSELRVLLAMAPGLSVKEAAEMLGMGETTAKKHLQNIYAKTGTSKQTELMHLFMGSAPPVRADTA